MRIDFRLNESTSPSLQLQRSVWTSRTKLFADGEEVYSKNGLFSKKRSYTVPMLDGSQRELVLANRFYDPVPKAYVDGEPLSLAKELKAWEYIIACVPLWMMFGGGLLGGIMGVASISANLGIMRSERPQGLRILLCCGITAVASLVTIFLAGLLQLALTK